MIEGVDYSRTANANWSQLAAELKANGKKFIGRYAVNDKSPDGRGITGEEYRAMRAAGLDVFLYWQTTTNWMLGGYAAGVVGAVNAQNNITAAGIPADTPVYFACDFDATPDQQAAIDDCLRGAASVLGAERVGLYAGYYPLMRAMQNGTARWLCQTTAWSGGNRLPQAHLYQYEYNQYYGGTNCDDVRAYQENFGQARETPVQPPKPERKPYPIPWKAGDVGPQKLAGKPALAYLFQLTAKKDATRRVGASSKEPTFGEKIRTGDKVTAIGGVDVSTPAGKLQPWVILDDLARVPMSVFEEKLPRP